LSTGAAVSLQLKKLAKATAAGRNLQRDLAAIEEAIHKEIGWNMKRPRGGIDLFYILGSHPGH